VTQPAPKELSDEDLVIRLAVKERERARSSRGMRAQAAAVVVLAALACWLVLVLARVPSVGYIGIGLATLAAAMTVPLAFGRFDLGALVAWGAAVRDRCPQCGQRRLREGRVIHRDVPDPAARTVDAIVILCVADGCGYAAARRIRYWPAAQ
jgi:hypothetical protein